MKYSLLVLLLFIFSCRPDTEKIIAGKWNVTELSYPKLDKLTEKLGGSLPSVFTGNDFFHFYENGTYTSLSFGNIFTSGKWKWENDSSLIILDPQGKLKVIKTSSKQLVVQRNVSNLEVQLTLDKDAGFDKPEKDDYTSLYNNIWRIKPTRPESYEEIVKRVRAVVHFSVLHLTEAGKGNTKAMDAVPLPIIMSPNGIRISEENEISDKWNKIFYDDNSALQAYHIFKDALPSEPSTKSNTGIPALAGLLKRTEPNIR